MASAFLSEEVCKYFSNEQEWQLASRIYWDRFDRRRPIDYDLEKYKIQLSYFNYLMEKYRRFLLHKYTSNK